MSKMKIGKHLSRRAFVRGAAMTGLGLAASGASAQTLSQSAIQSIINAPQRGSWDDQFDAQGSRGGQEVSSRVPMLSPETVLYVEDAIRTYNNIVMQGGWPMVPASNKLQLGDNDPAVSVLRQRLFISGDLPRAAGASNAFDTYVEGAVKRFQARHGLPADGVLGQYSFAALNVPANIRLGQLETNLVRLKSMSGFLGDRYVVVNIPAAQIEAVEGNRVVQRHTAIVGKISRQTPILNSKIHEIILNPYWTAPRSIVEKDIMPLMREDPTYLTRNNIRLFDYHGNEVSPQTIDWSVEEAPKLMFRQDPGKINAMASTKINFHNPHAVYMHDTPQQSKFGQLMRFESSGCVRVQNVRDLTTWLLENTAGWDRQTMETVIATGENTEIALADPVPVYFTYITAWSTSDGVVQFRDDIYHRDGVEELALQ
ncbi:L,D-transpeptidase family protein [Hoeflea sp. WL0058]|uniref:L,D-transpeptidase family protein n=1 Tax=Flavimaribacter sediminis TaxID=2865987 RepID=A0AAE2ZRN2_9HYPH|nr:L,D-transpeptidase family protein [Flavimaribacter sediminis]MBW8639691.1 L,D-transpeptidase family protein [Flavimaribacter sediminis]